MESDSPTPVLPRLRKPSSEVMVKSPPLSLTSPVRLPRLPSDRSLPKSLLISDRPDKQRGRRLESVPELGKNGEVLKKRKKVRTRVCSSADVLENVQKPKVALNPELVPLVNIYQSAVLSTAVLQSNGYPAPEPQHNYKLFIGPGNNDHLIARLMKRRWFWTRVDNWAVADFIWMQNRVTEVVQQIPASEERLEPGAPIAKRKVSRAVLAQAQLRPAGLELIAQSPCLVRCVDVPPAGPLKVYNRLEKNYSVTSKKWLFLNMKRYYESHGLDPFQVVPETFLVEEWQEDPQLQLFTTAFDENLGSNTWIIKPGENTNCGHGIRVSRDLQEIRTLVSGASKTRRRSFLIQRYLDAPLLISKRKFDIRCYGLVTCSRGHVQGYFYHDGYLRTSCKEFTLDNVEDRFIHLTNDAVQKTSDDYGKFENGNKLSYADFQRFLEVHFPGKVDFWRDIWPQIRSIMIDTFRATWDKLDPSRRMSTFEVLGYDFMVDQQFKVWLIEVNTNPCLSLGSTYLSRLIPAMLDNAFRIAIDPFFPEPPSKKHSQEWSTQPLENRFELVFSSLA